MGPPPADLPWTRVAPSPRHTLARPPLQAGSSAEGEPPRLELVAARAVPLQAQQDPGRGAVSVHMSRAGGCRGAKEEPAPEPGRGHGSEARRHGGAACLALAKDDGGRMMAPGPCPVGRPAAEALGWAAWSEVQGRQGSGRPQHQARPCVEGAPEPLRGGGPRAATRARG